MPRHIRRTYIPNRVLDARELPLPADAGDLTACPSIVEKFTTAGYRPRAVIIEMTEAKQHDRASPTLQGPTPRWRYSKPWSGPCQRSTPTWSTGTTTSPRSAPYYPRYNALEKELEKFGFEKSNVDACLWKYDKDGIVMNLISHVDDILCSYDDKDEESLKVYGDFMKAFGKRLDEFRRGRLVL